MFCWLQRRWLLASALSLAIGLLLQGSLATAAVEKGNFKRVKFQTVDSVELQGTFYPSAGNRKDTCVLLLHAVHPRAGGSSHDDAWDPFAVLLQKAGYDVLSFDFRGFGNSTSVGTEFWKFPYNQMIHNSHKKLDSISFKDFPTHYYPNLANDVAAARAYLNTRNDINSSNLVLVGAGEGATLGLIWMAGECRLQRDTASDQPAFVRPPPQLDPEPEGRDLACGIWLDISPTLGGGAIPVRVASLAHDVARKGKVRMVFLSSKNNAQGVTMAHRFVDAVNQGKTPKVAVSYDVPRAGKLVGSKLLQDDFDAGKWIVDDCLNFVLENRGNRQRRKHDLETFAYLWVFPWPNEMPVNPILAKDAKEVMLRPLPISTLLGRP